jgi:hypothetical protein
MSTHRKRPILILAFAFVIGLVGLLLGSGSGGGSGFGAPTIRIKTAAERRESLEALRAAWNARPEAVSTANEKAERYFLNRLIYFVRSTRGQEVYGDACRLWNECYHEHSSRYRDFVDAD